jgi:hypothetical protein
MFPSYGDTTPMSPKISAANCRYASPYRCLFSSLGRVDSGNDSV